MPEGSILPPVSQWWASAFSGQLPGHAREVAGRVPGYVLRVLGSHLRAEHPTPPRPPLCALRSPLRASGTGRGLCPLQFLRSHTDMVERLKSVRRLFRDAMLKLLLAETLPYAKL